MSHVAEIEMEINDLESLKKAADQLGFDVVEKNTYKWYGRSVGDYPLPTGFKKEDLGNCDFALKLRNAPNAYEIGVVKRRDGKPGYQLLWDFWNGGFGLTKAIGQTGGRIKQEYTIALAIKHQRRKGFRCTRFEDPDGNVMIRGQKREAI